jgi:WD40 repeat protein
MIYVGHTDFLNKIDTSKCNKYLLSCGGDGVRFFDMKSLKPLGGWRTNSIDEITSFLDEDGKSVFLFG